MKNAKTPLPLLSLLLLILMLVTPITAQVEHAPTPEQCRADADAWSIPKWGALVPNEDAFSNLSTLMMHDPNVSAKALDARKNELTVCVKTDKSQDGWYAQAGRAYAVAELGRMADFMQRHNLTNQFYQEDDQGKR